MGKLAGTAVTARTTGLPWRMSLGLGVLLNARGVTEIVVLRAGLDAGLINQNAFTVLVVPQVPLSFANSCLATADAARVYFGKAAERVRPGRLATTFGSADLLAGAISGMPVCHGAGGMTAHYAFGARTAAC